MQGIAGVEVCQRLICAFCAKAGWCNTWGSATWSPRKDQQAFSLKVSLRSTSPSLGPTFFAQQPNWLRPHREEHKERCVWAAVALLDDRPKLIQFSRRGCRKNSPIPESMCHLARSCEFRDGKNKNDILSYLIFSLHLLLLSILLWLNRCHPQRGERHHKWLRHVDHRQATGIERLGSSCGSTASPTRLRSVACDDSTSKNI